MKDPAGRKIGEIEDVVLDKTSNNIMFAAVSFGGLLGVTGSGALLARSLHLHGVKTAVVVGSGASVLPSTVAVYRHAIAGIFGAGALLVLAGLIVLLFLPELPIAGQKAD